MPKINNTKLVILRRHMAMTARRPEDGEDDSAGIKKYPFQGEAIVIITETAAPHVVHAAADDTQGLCHHNK